MMISSRLPIRPVAFSFLLAVFSVSGMTASSAQDVCVVEDPTGSRLNVRTTPNGTVLTTLPNGVRVSPLDELVVNGKRWLFVSRDGERLGWVFAAFLSCTDAKGIPGEATGGAPIPPSGRK